MTTLYGYVSNIGTPEYDDIRNSDLPTEEKVKQIQMRGQAYRDEIERQYRKNMARIGLGGLVSAVGALPIAITKNPVIGSAIGGGVYELGRGIMEGDKAPELLARSGLGGAIGGVTGGTVAKVGKTVSKLNNPWYVDEGLQNGKNALKYIYDKIIPKNSDGLPKVGTQEVIRNLRMEGGLPNGRGAYTQRSYNSPKAGVIAQYYPTKELENNFKVRDFETPKFNELMPNSDETAQLYYDTLKGIKDEYGKLYDTVSLHPVDEYKNMRLFLSPDKRSGFAIQPDGDIVSVFGAKKGSGTSHSMLELALQNKGTKLDNYDVPQLKTLYSNHGFNVTERLPWDDAYWDPQEWDKVFMQKTYGVAEPDITYRQIYDTNIYPEMQKATLGQILGDALK